MSKLKTYRFSDIYEISSGISSKPEQAGHGKPFLSFSTVFNNYFLPDELSDLMDISEDEEKTYSIREGDIFLTRTSETLDELGMSSVAVKNYPKASYSGFLKRIRPTKQGITYPKFMAFYLRSKLFRKTMNNNAIMTLRASFNEQIFSYLELILPEFNEQIKIGDLLYTMNQKIELNNKINYELEGMAKLIYAYWFVQFDFPFDFAQGKPADDSSDPKDVKPYKSSGGKMVWNKELKREIPEGWESDIVENLLAKETRTVKKLSSQYENYGLIPIIDQSTDFICGYTDDEESRITSELPRIVFGDHTRILKFINFDFARGADGTQVLLSKNKRVPQHFFYHTLLKIDLSNYGYARHFKFLKDTRIIIPNYELVRKFEIQAKSYYDTIKHNKFQNIQLSSLRDWLLPMLMNGQLRVVDKNLNFEEKLRMVAEERANYTTIKK